MLLTKIRKRKEGDPPEDGTEALFMNEQGEFVLQRLKTMRKTNFKAAIHSESDGSDLE